MKIWYMYIKTFSQFFLKIFSSKFGACKCMLVNNSMDEGNSVLSASIYSRSWNSFAFVSLQTLMNCSWPPILRCTCTVLNRKVAVRLATNSSHSLQLYPSVDVSYGKSLQAEVSTANPTPTGCHIIVLSFVWGAR